MTKKRLFWISLSLIALFAVIFLAYAATHFKQSPPFTLDTRDDSQRALSHWRNSASFMLDTRDDSQRALTHRALSKPFRLDVREDTKIYASHSALSSPFVLNLRQPPEYTAGIRIDELSTYPQVTLVFSTEPASLIDKIGVGDFKKVTENGKSIAFTPRKSSGEWHLTYTSPHPTSSRNYITVYVRSTSLNANPVTNYVPPVVTQFSLTDASGVVGQNVGVPFSMSETEFHTAHFAISFESSQLTYVDATSTVSAISIGSVDSSQPGFVIFDLTGNMPFGGGKTLYITFKISDSAQNQIALHLTNVSATGASGQALAVQTQDGTIEIISISEPVVFSDFLPAEGEKSEIMQGGILHRHYKVKSGEELIKNAVVHLDTAQGAAESSAEINGYGIVGIPFDVGNVGPGSYEFSLPVISVEFSGQTFPVATPLPSFGVEVMPREWAKEWELGGSINGVLFSGKGDIGGSLGVQILVNAADADFGNTLILERQLNGKIGAEVGVGASFKLGLIGGKAELAGAAGSAGLAIGDRFRYPNFDQSYGQIAVLLLDQLDTAGILRNPASRLVIDALANIYGVGIESGFDAASVVFIAEGEANVGTLVLGPQGSVAKGVPFLKNVAAGRGLQLGGTLLGANASVSLGAEIPHWSIYDTIVFGEFEGRLDTLVPRLEVTQQIGHPGALAGTRPLKLKVLGWLGPERELTLSERIKPFGDKAAELSLGTGDGSLHRTQIFTLDDEVVDAFLDNQKTVAGGLLALSIGNPLPVLGVGNSPLFIEELKGMVNAIGNSSYREEHDEFDELSFALELKLKAGLSFGFSGSIDYEQHKCYDVERGVQIGGLEYVLESGYSNDFFDPYTVEHIVEDTLKEAAPVIESTLAYFKKAADAVGNAVVDAVDATNKAVGKLTSRAQAFGNHVLSLVPFKSAGGSAGMQAFGTSRQARQHLLGMRQQNELDPHAATVGQSMLVNVEDENGEVIWDYQDTLELMLYYSADDLAAVGLSETDEPALRIFWWDDSIRRWTQIGGAPNIEGNSVFANISHSGTYAIGIDTKNPAMGIAPKDGSTVGPNAKIEIAIDDFLAIEQSTVSVILNDGTQNLTLIDNTNIAEHYDAIANVITYEFEQPLAAGSYVLYVHICDSAGNCSDGQSSFTVDADAFEFVASNPADGAGDVSPVDKITTTFSKNIEPDTVNLGAVQLRNDESDIPVEGVLTVENKTMSVKPRASLLPGVAYTLTIRGGEGGIRDVAGKILADDISLGFTTADTQIVANKLELNVPTACPINGSAQVTLSAKNGDVLVSTYTGTVIFTSTDENAQLPEPYTFHRGDSGEHKFIVTFKTKGTHTLTIEDEDGLTVTSEDITVSSSPQITLAAIEPNIVPNDGTTQIAFRATIIDPDGLENLANVKIDLTLIGGLDAAQLLDDGNNGDGEANDGIYGLTNITVPETVAPNIYSFEITTTDNDGETGTLYLSITVIDANPPDTTIPTVTMTPSNNTTGVPIDTSVIELIFSEEMDESTLTTEMLTVEDDEGNPIDGTFAVIDSTKIQYTLANPLTYSTSYYVTVRGGALGVKDRAGNGLAGDFVGMFRARDYGDVSANGTITAFDATLILQHLVGLITLSDEAQLLADVSNDGTISGLDASLILRRVVGIEGEFPAEGGTMSPASTHAGVQTTHNSVFRLSVGNVRAKPGEKVRVPVTLEGEGILGGEFVVEFDEALKANVIPKIAGLTFERNVENGKIRFAFAGMKPIAAKAELLQSKETGINSVNALHIHIEFDVPDDVADGSVFPLRIVDARLNEVKRIVKVDGSIEILPSKTALLANYPNPFNPDTWIPYQLADDANVTIKIYDVGGRLVRTLHIGRKDAGSYIGKEKAVHWNGRNEAGERTATGVYFYSIQAGQFTATRKMLVLK